jgi:hypothetical protein
MDPNPSNEEFVHIENPSDNDNHLSESIVDVANELSEVDNKNDDVVERKELPEELSRSVMVLTCESKAEGGTCVVHLVGTAHVCQVKIEILCISLLCLVIEKVKENLRNWESLEPFVFCVEWPTCKFLAEIK